MTKSYSNNEKNILFQKLWSDQSVFWIYKSIFKDWIKSIPSKLLLFCTYGWWWMIRFLSSITLTPFQLLDRAETWLYTSSVQLQLSMNQFYWWIIFLPNFIYFMTHVHLIICHINQNMPVKEFGKKEIDWKETIL